MWGIPESELEGRDFNRVFAFVLSIAKDPEAVLGKLRQMEENPGQAGSDVIELKDGRIFEQHCNPRLFKGEIVGIVCSFREVTESKRMVDKLNRSIARLSKKSRHEVIINDLSRGISEYAEVEDILDAAVYMINRNIENCDFVSIYFVENNDAVLMAQRGYPDWFIERAGRIPYPKGFTWKAILDGNPILYCEDADRDSVLGPAGRKLGTKSIVSMPIRADGSVTGVIKIDSLKKDAFDDEELKMLEIVSQMVERAIQKAQVAEALRRSEERYRVLFNQSPVGVFIFDKELRITQCNKRLTDILQSSHEKVIGLDLNTLKDKSFFNAMKTATEGAPSYHEGVYEATTSPVKLWLSLYYSPLLDAGGTVIGGMGVVEDITDRKLAEEALRENERMLSTLLSNLPGCSYRSKVDNNWTLDFISEGVFPLTGFTADEYLTLGTVTYAEIIHPDDRSRVRGEMLTALENQQPFDLVYRIITKSREEKWVWDKGRGIYPADGGPPYIEGFVTDITERKRLEVQLRRAQRWRR
jgi:PAS domain S-box-containing protein